MGNGEVLDYIVIRRREVKGWFLELEDIISGVDWVARCFETYSAQGSSKQRVAWLESCCPALWRSMAANVWLRMSSAWNPASRASVNKCQLDLNQSPE